MKKVIFHEKVFSAPYYPFFELYRYQEFEITGEVDEHYVLKCVTNPNIIVNGIIDKDLVIDLDSIARNAAYQDDMRRG